MKINRIFTICTLLLTIVFRIQAQEWVIADPDMINPTEFNQENINLGNDLYNTHCKSCHGDPGANNALALQPPPPDITSQQMQSNKDGEIFYKILNGKLTMPQFKNILSEDDIWHVISYVRSFNENYQPDSVIIADNQQVSDKAELKIQIDSDNEKILVKVTTRNEEGVSIPMAGIKVNFFIQRYFGNLKFNSSKTNNNGEISIPFPLDIPGNETGQATLIVSLDGELKNISTTMENANICAPTQPINIFEKRIMWSENHRTQWWIILTYLGVVIGVWSTIFYVVFQISRIPKASRY